MKNVIGGGMVFVTLTALLNLLEFIRYIYICTYSRLCYMLSSRGNSFTFAVLLLFLIITGEDRRYAIYLRGFAHIKNLKRKCKAM